MHLRLAATLLGCALLGNIVAAQPAAAPSAATAQLGGLSPVDAAFDIRLELLLVDKGEAAAFAFLKKEFARDPRPHVKARYAEFLVGGKDWGAPEDQGAGGWALALEAREAGSLHALRVIGWDKFTGTYSDKDPALGIVLLRIAANAGNSNAIITLGDVYLHGMGGTAIDLAQAEQWFMRAAILGKPHSLTRLAKTYEENVRPPNRAKAALLYYEAATRGSGTAERRLRELTDQKDPDGSRAHRLSLLWRAYVGADLQTTVVRQAADSLLAEYPNDPHVLLAVGRIHGYHLRDFKKAYAYCEQAARLGLDDARVECAELLAEGSGVTKDPARAVAELRELAEKGNAAALALLGYYHYWGALPRDLVPKDAAKAFEYSRRAADAGDYAGQKNAGACYEFGIGTKTDYAFAAYYYRAAAWRGSRRAQEKVKRLLPFVLK